MSVEIRDGSVESGTSRAIFDNDGGFLSIVGIEVSGATAAALVATANGGISFLQNSMVTGSSMESVTYTDSTGAQSVTNVNVADMRDMDDTFYVEGTGSSLRVSDSIVSGNDIPESPWTVVNVRSAASGQVSRSTIANNTGIENGVAAGGTDSNLLVQQSSLLNNTGVVSSSHV